MHAALIAYIVWFISCFGYRKVMFVGVVLAIYVVL